MALIECKHLGGYDCNHVLEILTFEYSSKKGTCSVDRKKQFVYQSQQTSGLSI